jgi:hypothetical protein
MRDLVIMKSLAAVQSSYIPWKGYFDLIGSVDLFVLYDDVAYSKGGWRNRNRIRVPDGVRWLTIPVATRGRFAQRVEEVEVSDPRWAVKHLQSLRTYYSSAAGFSEVFPWLVDLYRRASELPSLSQINELFLREICSQLGLETEIRRSSEFELPENRVGRLIELCRQCECDIYLSGPAAKSYLDERDFTAAAVEVRWMNYSGYAEYFQTGGPPFIHEVTVLDLILNEGVEFSRAHLANHCRRG